MELRDYQQKFFDDVKDSFKNNNHAVCGVMPCGSGKTVVAAHIVQGALEKDNRVVFLVHRKELIDQTADTFSKLNIPFGLISSDSPQNYSLPVQIASVQTLVCRLEEVPEPQFIICDECHHILAESYLQIINRWKSAYLLGLTATPERLGGIRLGDVFTSLIKGPSVKQLIARGDLAPFVHFVPAELDFSGLRVRAGEFVTDDAAQFMCQTKIIGNIVDTYKLRADGKQAICYCVNVEHSKIMADKFNAAGIPAAQCDAETPKSERRQIIANFRNGNFKILCNVELFGEGFDVPNVDAVILARPTKSLTLYIQQAMRALRPDPNNPDKVAVILDHVNNGDRFGDIDINRQWSLDPNEDKKSHSAPTKFCPKCGTEIPLAARICLECGQEFDFVQDLTEHDGFLVKIARELKEFLIIAKKRGYKRYWAVCKALEHAESYDDCLHIGHLMGYKKGWAWYQWRDISKE